MAQVIEHEFLGGSKAKRWTYLIVGTLLLVGAVAAQAAWEHPDQARLAMQTVLGLPGWALIAITAGVGWVIFYLGLKIEADWPEAMGAAMLAGSFMALEMLIGLQHFVLGGVSITPYVLPLLLFAVLFGVGLARSR